MGGLLMMFPFDMEVVVDEIPVRRAALKAATPGAVWRRLVAG
jgi:hypothetical protein